MSRRLLPLLNRIVVEKLTQPTKTVGGIMLPESAAAKIQEGVVIATGPGTRSRDGEVLPMSLKNGDKVLLPSYGGTEVKMEEKEYLVFSEDDILAKIE